MITWKSTLLVNEANAVLPLVPLITRGIYDQTPPPRGMITRASLCFAVSVLRVTATWIAILLLTFSHGFAGTTFGVVMLVTVAALADVEYHATSHDMVRQLNLNESRNGLLYFVLAALPVNYMFNIVADRDTTVKLAYATLQSGLRIGLLAVLATLHWIYPLYRDAWSCYMQKPIAEYVHGYCPIYTQDWSDNFACRNRVASNIACYPGQGHANNWKNPHVLVHITTLLTAALYGQHVLNVWIYWIRLMYAV